MTPANELTHIDLFTGIGGFTIAAQQAGFRTLAFSETNTYASEHLRRRYPDIPNIGDVRNTSAFCRHSPVTLLTGGFPCQPWSGSGLMRGAEDYRHLWPAMRDIIAGVRPAWVVGENVPRIITLGGADAVLDDLENLGYSAQSFIIPARSVGARHTRDRFWILAHDEHRAPRSEKLEIPDAMRAGCGQFHPAALAENETQRLLWHHPVGASALRHPCWNADFAEVLRMADGLSLGLDSGERRARIHALGNAIVPQVAQQLLTHIARIETLF